MSRLVRFVFERIMPVTGLVLIVLGFLVIHRQGQELHQNVRNQIVNRATNVEAWCGGINSGRDYNRLFVTRVTDGRVAYTLPDLPCEELVRQTLASPKRTGPVTAADHPLVYRVLHPKH